MAVKGQEDENSVPNIAGTNESKKKKSFKRKKGRKTEFP